MGSIFSPNVPPPPPPPPEPSLTGFRSEITGVEQIPVKNPDGTTTIVQKFSLTPEQQAIKDNLERISQQQLKKIESLTTNFDVDKIPGLADTLKTFRETNQRVVDVSFRNRARGEEKSLAKVGQADSTAASELRAIRGSDRSKAEEKVLDSEELLKQSIRQNEIGNAVGLFNIAAQQDAFGSQKIANSLAQGGGLQSQLLNAQTQQNLAIYNGGLQQQQLQFGANQAGFQNLAGTIGLATLLAGPAGFGFLGGAGAAASDRKLKTNIVKVGVENGYNIYEFKYKTKPGVYRGVMADEVEKIKPEAVTIMDGYKAVYYDKIGVELRRVA